MITSLSTEDNIQIENSLQEFSFIFNNTIAETIENLNELLKYDNTNITTHEITESIRVFSEFHLKLQELESLLDKINLVQDFRTNLKNIIIKLQEYTAHEDIGRYLDKIIGKLLILEEELIALENDFIALEQKTKEAAYLKIIIGYLEAFNKPDDDKLIWLQHLSRSIFFVLDILEKEDACIISKSVLKSIETYSEALSSNKKLSEYIKTLANNENEQDIKNYIYSIKNATKAILWQLKKIKEEQPNVQSLLKFIQSSPEWKGDDFKECLDFINEERRK